MLGLQVRHVAPGSSGGRAVNLLRQASDAYARTDAADRGDQGAAGRANADGSPDGNAGGALLRDI